MGASLDHAENTATNQDHVEETGVSQDQVENISVSQEQPDDAGQNQAGRCEKLKEDDKEAEEEVKAEKLVSIGTSTVLVETQEVVSSTTSVSHDNKSSTNNKLRPAPRRGSYQPSRGYAGNYQNYGLAYLPYKSNFEPSEDARRRADEFLKTLRL